MLPHRTIDKSTEYSQSFPTIYTIFVSIKNNSKNLKMKIIATILMLISCYFVNAQHKYRYGVLASYELRGTSGDASFGSLYPSENRFVSSYSLGGFIEKELSKKISVSLEPTYQQIGASKFFEYYTYNSERVTKFTAIQMPVAFKIKLGKLIYTELGVAPVYILTGKETTTTTNSTKVVIREEKYEYLDQKYGSQRIQFPLFIGLGFNLTKSLEIGMRGYLATEKYTYTGQDVYNPTNTPNSIYDPAFKSTRQNQGLAFRLKYNFAK